MYKIKVYVHTCACVHVHTCVCMYTSTHTVQAEDARETAEKELQEITEIARREVNSNCLPIIIITICTRTVFALQISLFKEKYVQCFRGNLIGYADSQLTHSKRTHKNLTAIRDQLLE